MCSLNYVFTSASLLLTIVHVQYVVPPTFHVQIYGVLKSVVREETKEDEENDKENEVHVCYLCVKLKF